MKLRSQGVKSRIDLLDRVTASGDVGIPSLALPCSHHPEQEPFSPCMHRDDANIVSCTLVEWTNSSLRWTTSTVRPAWQSLDIIPSSHKRSAADVVHTKATVAPSSFFWEI